MEIGSLDLTPTFSADTYAYTATTTNDEDTVTATAITPSTVDSITVNGDSIDSGDSVTWEDGENIVAITAKMGSATKQYTVVVTKE